MQSWKGLSIKDQLGFLCPRIEWSAYCFCPVCLFVSLFVCLSVVNSNLRHNFWTVRDRDIDLESKNSFFIRPSSDGTYYGMVMSVRPSVRHSFPHFSPTCFEILSWNFVYHFIMMHVRASSNAINFRQFLMELCPFLTPNCYKYAVFRTFLLHALTFWAEILHMTLFYCTTEQVRVSSISVNFCWSYAPFGT